MTSVIGFFASCGLLSPVGLILSLIACGRRPRGFAIAGVIIGLLGCFWLLVFFLFIGMAGITFVFMLLGVGRYGEVAADYAAIQSEVSAYVASTRTLPSTLADMPALTHDQTTDPWGQPYLFTPDPTTNSFTLISPGPDQKLATDDDVKIEHTVNSP